jgi:hypothetical protein
MERRDLLSGGVLAGVGQALGLQRTTTSSPPDNEAVSGAIDELRRVIDRGQQVSPELSRIRDQQRVFLRANQKFPDYLEIGIAIWESVYDWHVRHLIPINITRMPDGRYSMVVMLTTLILRPEQPETFIGFGYDLR